MHLVVFSAVGVLSVSLWAVRRCSFPTSSRNSRSDGRAGAGIGSFGESHGAVIGWRPSPFFPSCLHPPSPPPLLLLLLRGPVLASTRRRPQAGEAGPVARAIPQTTPPQKNTSRPPDCPRRLRCCKTTHRCLSLSSLSSPSSSSCSILSPISANSSARISTYSFSCPSSCLTPGLRCRYRVDTPAHPSPLRFGAIRACPFVDIAGWLLSDCLPDYRLGPVAAFGSPAYPVVSCSCRPDFRSASSTQSHFFFFPLGSPAHLFPDS